MKTGKYISLMFLIPLSIVSCREDMELEEEVAPVFIEEELMPYFDDFRLAALDRDITVNYDSAQIHGILTELPDLIPGQCFQNNRGLKEVRIDEAYWNSASEIEREFIIFHELGHCFLGRSHLDTENLSGVCVSIMHSGTSGCRNAYNLSTRRIYLDELFEAQ